MHCKHLFSSLLPVLGFFGHFHIIIWKWSHINSWDSGEREKKCFSTSFQRVRTFFFPVLSVEYTADTRLCVKGEKKDALSFKCAQQLKQHFYWLKHNKCNEKHCKLLAAATSYAFVLCLLNADNSFFFSRKIFPHYYSVSFKHCICSHLL